MKLFIIGLFILLALFIFIRVNFHPINQQFPLQDESSVTIQGITFQVLLAETPKDQELGLGNRKSLPENQGMLFIFPHPTPVAFWMKGMEFPLDIIYIKDATIVDIFQNLPNPTATHPETPTITPLQPANFVLEINAGLAKKYHFKQGDYAKIAL